MNKFRLSLFAVVLLVLTGCATPNLDKGYSIKETSKKGVIIASLTKTGHGHWPPGYNFKHITGSTKGILEFKQNMFDRIVSDFSGVEGKLVVLELPAGEYKISRWFINQGYIGLESRKGFDLRFEVRPGNVTYIGELNNDREAGGIFGIGLGRMTFNIKNSKERDLGEVQKEYPNMSLASVETNLITILGLGGK